MRTVRLLAPADGAGPEDRPAVAFIKMAIYDAQMDISVTQFKARCLDLIRKVEKSRESVVIRRHGRIVARLQGASDPLDGDKPWERLRALGGRARIEANESVWREEDFEALR